VWKALRHPNVLPLLGVTMIGNRLAMVSEWMARGNINEFLKTNVNADRLGLVRFLSKVLIPACPDQAFAVAEGCHDGLDLYA